MSARGKVFWAFFAIYVFWGSTYLAIQIGVHAMPPFFLGAIRFLVAGAILYGWARLHGEPTPPAPIWRETAVLGTLFFVLGNGLVVWAEQHVPSGRTALLASTTPIWVVVLESGLAGWRRPSFRVVLGVVTGFAGVGLLATPSEAAAHTVTPLGLLALITAAFAWAAGSVFSHRRHLPVSPAMATGMKMLGGGALLAIVAVATGDWRRAALDGISWQGWAAVAYLVVFGSIIGFTAFTYLLRVTTPQRVGTSAYVNPMVALALGWGLAGEIVTPRMLLGAGVSLLGVLLIRWTGPEHAAEPTDVGAVETGEFPVAGAEGAAGRPAL